MNIYTLKGGSWLNKASRVFPTNHHKCWHNGKSVMIGFRLILRKP